MAQPIPAEGRGLKCHSILAAKMQGHLASKQNMNHACVLVAFVVAFREIKQRENEADYLGCSFGGIPGGIKLSCKGKEVASIKHDFNDSTIVNINVDHFSSTISNIMPYTDANQLL